MVYIVNGCWSQFRSSAVQMVVGPFHYLVHQHWLTDSWENHQSYTIDHVSSPESGNKLGFFKGNLSLFCMPWEVKWPSLNSEGEHSHFCRQTRWPFCRKEVRSLLVHVLLQTACYKRSNQRYWMGWPYLAMDSREENLWKGLLRVDLSSKHRKRMKHVRGKWSKEDCTISLGLRCSSVLVEICKLVSSVLTCDVLINT